VITHCPEYLIQAVESFADALPGSVARQVSDGLQAHADGEDAAGDPVQQLLGAVRLAGETRAPGRQIRDQVTARASCPG
jgi:hypothetical protein